MNARWLCVLALLTLLALSGCGGGAGVPVLVAGNYFPLTIGTVWTYATSLEAEVAGIPEFTTTGTFVRTLEGTTNLLVDGVLTTTYRFRHDYTALATPPPIMGPAILHLFSNPGGLQSVRAYYRLVAATPDMPTHMELVALERIPGPITNVTTLRPYLFNPAYDGAQHTANIWFTPQPLMPFVTEMAGFELNDKLLDYAVLGGIGGNANTVVSIYNFAANLPAYGVGINGRGRVFYKDGVGLFGVAAAEFTEFAATLSSGADSAQVIAQSYLVSML